MRRPALLGAVWVALAAGLMVPAAPPAAAPPDYPLPSDEGASLLDAWDAAWALANATPGAAGAWQLHGLEGFENVHGFGPNWTYRGRGDLQAGVEALDGRVQHDGFWQFLFRDGPSGPALRVAVDRDGQAHAVPVPANSAFLSSPLVQAPRFDTPQAVLECRRMGADVYLSEMDETFVYSIARPLRDQPGQWMLFIVFSSLVDQPGEIESASCRLHEGTGTLAFVNPEAPTLVLPTVQLEPADGNGTATK